MTTMLDFRLLTSLDRSERRRVRRLQRAARRWVLRHQRHGEIMLIDVIPMPFVPAVAAMPHYSCECGDIRATVGTLLRTGARR